MTKRITMKEGVIYRPHKELSYSTLYKLIQFCEETGQRFGQVLWNTLGYTDPALWQAPEGNVLFYIEDDQLERRIKEYITTNSTGKG